MVKKRGFPEPAVGEQVYWPELSMSIENLLITRGHGATRLFEA
jgi:hypothetical protein